MDNTFKKIFKESAITSNPLFVSLLGMCPALAITGSFMNAIGMTLAILIVLVLSNVTISAIRKIIPNEIRIPIYIIIVATFTSCVDLLMNAFTPELYSTLGIFIQLIVVNCIILGRAEAFASKNSVKDSAIDGLASAVGYGVALMIISLVREILGTQALVLSNPFNSAQSVTIPLLTSLKIPFFTSSAGAFITLGIILAIISAIVNKQKEKALKKEDK